MKLLKHPYAPFIALIAAAWAFYAYHFFNFFWDDAYISLTYARNLVAGEGLTWSGQYVEGYTNFLFVILCAGLHFITGIALPLCTRIINGAAFFGIMYLAWNYARLLTRGKPEIQFLQPFAVFAVGCSLPLVAWVFGGLESVFFAYLCTLPLYWLLIYAQTGDFSRKQAILLGIVLVAATLTRPEGLMITGLAAITGIAIGIRRNDNAKNLAVLFVHTALPYLLIVAPYIAWKLHYYGDILPNTYYAKATGIPLELQSRAAFLYLFNMIFSLPLYGFYSIFLVGYLAFKRALHMRHMILLSWMGAYMIYTFCIGADYMIYFRFMLPVIVWQIFLILDLFCLFLTTAQKRTAKESYWLFIALTCLQLLNSHADNFDTSVERAKSQQAFLEKRLPVGSLIAVNAAGYLPFIFPQYKYIDMLGLNDRHIARTEARKDGRATAFPGHWKTDAAYVLSKKPDVIFFSYSSGKPRLVTDFEMADLPQFKKNYVKVEFPIIPEKRLIPELRKAGSLNAKGEVIMGFYVHKNLARHFAPFVTDAHGE